MFDQLDLDKNGHLSVVELHLLFTKSLKVRVSLEQVKELVRSGDDSGNGLLEFDEFLKVNTNATNTSLSIIHPPVV